MHECDKDELKSLFSYNKSINQRLMAVISIQNKKIMYTIARFELTQETWLSAAKSLNIYLLGSWYLISWLLCNKLGAFNSVHAKRKFSRKRIAMVKVDYYHCFSVILEVYLRNWFTHPREEKKWLKRCEAFYQTTFFIIKIWFEIRKSSK